MFEINKSKTVRDSDFLNNRSNDTTRKIEPYLKKSDRILDVGSGGAHIAKALKDLGYNVTLLDIKNKCYFEDVQPIIYDGKTIPFDNDTFDVALLLTVLHHTKDPLAVLAEAKRVSKRMIIIEDLYDS